MGFRIQRTVYRLVFEDERLRGLTVRAHGTTVGRFLEIVRLSKEAEKHESESAEKLFKLFSDSLVSWDAETEDGEPIPANAHGLGMLDMDIALLIIRAWMDAIAGVPAPLDGKSDSGAPFPAELIPMDSL